MPQLIGGGLAVVGLLALLAAGTHPRAVVTPFRCDPLTFPIQSPEWPAGYDILKESSVPLAAIEEYVAGTLLDEQAGSRVFVLETGQRSWVEVEPGACNLKEADVGGGQARLIGAIWLDSLAYLPFGIVPPAVYVWLDRGGGGGWRFVMVPRDGSQRRPFPAVYTADPEFTSLSAGWNQACRGNGAEAAGCWVPPRSPPDGTDLKGTFSQPWFALAAGYVCGGKSCGG